MSFVVLLLGGIFWAIMIYYVLLNSDNMYVNDLFIRAHFTHNEIDKISIDYVTHYKYSSLKVSYLVFHDTDGNKFVCTTYEYPKEIDTRMYSNTIQYDVMRILGNDDITITYAAEPTTGKLYIRAE